MKQILRDLVLRTLSGSLLVGGIGTPAAAAVPEHAKGELPPYEPELGTGNVRDAVVLRERRPRLILARAPDMSVTLVSSHRSHRSHSSHRSHYSSSGPPRRTPPPPPARAPATLAGGALGSRTLVTGMKGADVLELMRYLMIYGVLNVDQLNSDSLFTREVDTAVRVFQRSRNLEVDGQVGPGTTLLLKHRPCAVVRRDSTYVQALGSRTLESGMRGADVAELMRYLIIHGHLSFDKVNRDSLYTADVETAVRAFQRSRAIPADGKVNRSTANLLMGLSC